MVSCEFSAFLSEASCWQLRVQKGLVKHGDGHSLMGIRQAAEKESYKRTGEHQVKRACDRSGSKSGRE